MCDETLKTHISSKHLDPVGTFIAPRLFYSAHVLSLAISTLNIIFDTFSYKIQLKKLTFYIHDWSTVLIMHQDTFCITLYIVSVPIAK